MSASYKFTTVKTPKIEYEYVFFNSFNWSSIAGKVVEYAALGWELDKFEAATPSGGAVQYYVIMKREKRNAV